MAINQSRLNEFLGKAVSDLGAALSATLVLVGDRLGLYKELAQGALTSAELRDAQVGCGHGASTVLMAKTYPKSTFVGYDYHGESIRVARERAAAAGIAKAQFEVSDAVSYSGKDFDVIAFFDCLHDMGDPVGVARHARQALKSGGKSRRATETPFNLVLEARP